VSGYRLPGAGAARVLRFSFDGRPLVGKEGDTLAAALIAGGERVVARSFKYHRPRGIWGIGLEEPNALMQVGDDVQALATRVPLADGLVARAVNAWPSARFDLRAVHDLFGRLLPAGFYYKTFMGPPFAWPLYERAIRHAAGLGRLRRGAVPWRSESLNAHADALVVGAGPAGLAAALVLARSGARVTLCDDGEAPGGARGAKAGILVDGQDAAVWMTAAHAELAALGARILPRTLVFALHDDGFALAAERAPTPDLDERLWKLRVSAIVLACGAVERPLVFADNDRPGVMSLSAVRGYAERFGIACGRTIAVLANNDQAYADAAALRRLGIGVTAIADLRRVVSSAAVELAARLGIATLGNQAALGIAGKAVEGLRLAPLERLDAMRTLDCDVVAVSGGWTPLVHLHCHAGGRVAFDEARQAFLPVPDARPILSAGACAGQLGWSEALIGGGQAGAEAARRLGRKAPPLGIADVIAEAEFDGTPAAFVAGPSRDGRKAFVDLASDVTSDDIRLAAREGYGAIEHMKRYTTAGMSIDQGRFGNIEAIQLLAAARDIAPSNIGTTTYRPPFAPVAFGTLARRGGGMLAPVRTTPLTAWHAAAGAVMYDVGGGWRRPGYYPLAGEALEHAVARECAACRNAAAIYDSSPLGKFEVQGRDVVAFLERIYSIRLADLAPGQGRYALMLLEDGRVFDDGVVFRLAADRFLLHSTTGNAEAVLQRLEYHRQVVWPELQIRLAPVTTQWADIVVCGPRAREILADAGTDVALDRASFPFMSLRHGRVAGVPARVLRVSFTGELSFEIQVAARQAPALWERLIELGGAHGAVPLGSEANHVLRIEKGFISVGHEADGIADPFDLGMKWAVAMDKPDFVGKRALERNLADPLPRPQLVGLLAEDPRFVPPEGAAVLDESGARGRGFVTASCMSGAAGRSVALAMIEDGRRLMDASVELFAPAGTRHRAKIVRPAFFDPRGERMRG
jgi:sarcosine oxidase, subunit alpha